MRPQLRTLAALLTALVAAPGCFAADDGTDADDLGAGEVAGDVADSDGVPDDDDAEDASDGLSLDADGDLATTSDALGGGKPFVHGIFRSQMVLQRDDARLAIHGFAKAGTPVRVRAASLGVDVTVTASSKGRWKAPLGALAAGGPHTIEITSAAKSETLTDVLVGDVYLVAGQSNANRAFGHWAGDSQISAKWKARAADEMKKCVGGGIRFWKTKTGGDVGFPSKPFASPVPHFDGGWTACNADVVRDVTAMGYVMARELSKSSDVPIGIVQATIPATNIDCWLAKGDADKTATNASRCYNSMIAPLGVARFKSALWYQGEANAGKAASTKYRARLDRLLTTWREDLDDKSLPFAIVRLAPFDQGGAADTYWARVQKAQETVAADRNEATIVKLDADSAEERKTIHPPDKWEAGAAAAAAMKRLATGKY